MLTRPVRKLYKLEICAESDNLPPITRLPEDTDKDDEILDSEADMKDGEEEAEHEVPMPQALGVDEGLSVQVALETESQLTTASCEVEVVES